MRLFAGWLCLLLISGCGSPTSPDPAVAESEAAVSLSIGGAGSRSSAQGAANVSSTEFQPVIRQLVEKARQAVVQGQPGIAVEALSQAIGVNPGDARLLRMRADVYVLMRENANARADFSTAIRTDPDNAELYNVRGYFLMTNGITGEARADFDKALELNPSLAPAWNNRGLVLLAGQDYAAAEQQFRQAVASDENYADGWNNLGFARMKQNRLDEALVDIQRALRLNPEYVAAWNNAGLIQMRQENHEAAVESFSKAIECAPMDARWYGHRRAALLELERFDEAAQDDRRAKWLAQLSNLSRQTQANVRDPDRWINRGDWLADGDEFGAAIQDYTLALRLQPDSTRALNARARAFARTGDLRQAITDCDESLVIRPTQEAYSIRGDAWLAMNNLDQAIEDYEQAQRFDTQIAEAYRRRAARLRESGDHERAEEDLVAARRIEEGLAGKLADRNADAAEPVPFPDSE